jgi:hypothetical protein
VLLVQGPWLRVEGSGSRVESPGFRVLDSELILYTQGFMV